MCGKFYYDEETFEYIKKIVDEIDYEEDKNHFDYSPGEKIPVIIFKDKKLVLDHMTWGYTISQNQQRVINARSETLFQKKFFKDDDKLYRCVIAAKGFYAWDNQKNKISFERRKMKMIFMGGIYHPHKKEIAIITVPAHENIKSIHPRMPFIIEYENIKKWLVNEENIEKYLSPSLNEIEVVAGHIQQSLFDENE